MSTNITNNYLTQPLSFLDNAIYWNPAFSLYHLDNGYALFLSEHHHFISSTEEIKRVQSFLLAASHQQNNQLDLALTFLITQLKEAHILIHTPLEVPYVLPHGCPTQHIQYENGDIINLTNIPSHLLYELAKKVFEATTTPLNILCIDDFQDPELFNIIDQYIKGDTPWLVLKLTGDEMIIGPYFSSSDYSASSCLVCTTLNMFRNQPIRKWASGHTSAWIHYPINTSLEHLEKNWNAVLEQMSHLVKQQIPHTLITIAEEINTHSSAPHPQCEYHGFHTQNNTFSSTLPQLQSNLKMPLKDGGYRVVRQSDAIQKLKSFVSPLTGIINNISALTNNEGGINIYTASFSRVPQLHNRTPSFTYYSLGKGVSNEQSEMSALAEAVERFSAMYDGTEAFRFSKVADLDAPALLPQQLKQYSSQQLVSFQQNPHELLSIEELPADQALRWTLSHSLISHQKYYIPFTYCHSNTPFEDERYVRFDSNGCAVGNVIEEAILQGFLELIERDAVAVWWYNKILRPQIDLTSLNDHDFTIIQDTIGKDWEYWILDLTHDFEIPVVAAIGRYKNTETYRMGFGAHLDIAIACKRALTELYQIIVVGNQKNAAFSFGSIQDQPFLMGSSTSIKSVTDFNSVNHHDLKDDVLFCLNKAKSLGFDVLAVDLSKMPLPLKTVKVVVPGLNFIWPEFGNQRLYDLPVQLGWQSKRLHEDELNSLALFL